MPDADITALELTQKYSKEQLAVALVQATKSEIRHLDNGCGNDLNFNRVLNRHLPKSGA